MKNIGKVLSLMTIENDVKIEIDNTDEVKCPCNSFIVKLKGYDKMNLGIVMSFQVKDEYLALLDVEQGVQIVKGIYPIPLIEEIILTN